MQRWSFYWLYAGLLLFALGLPMIVFVGTLIVDETPRLQTLYATTALAEGAASVALAIYLAGKYSHYDCG